MDFQWIGKRIRTLRRQAGLTQEQLAERANLSPSYLSHVERGTKRLSLDALEQIAEALAVPMTSLLTSQTSDGSAPLLPEALLAPCTAGERQIILEVARTLARCLRESGEQAS